MEAGNCTAGHRDEQNGEQRAQLFVFKTSESGQVHGGMCGKQADHSTGDHENEHKSGHVIAGLFEQPHGQHGSKEDINKGDIAPGGFGKDQRAGHANGKRGHDAHNAQYALFPAGKIHLLLDQAKYHSEHHKHDAHHTGSAVGAGSIRKSGHAIGDGVGIKGACHHIGKGGDDDQAEQPAEQQKQLAAQFADVLFDQHAHALAIVLHRGIQGAEVSDSTEKHTAQQHPQQHRQPAEGGSLNGTGDGACACNGRELVAEHCPAVGGNKILAVIKLYGRGFSLGVDTPFFRQPAAVKQISAQQPHSGDQYDYQGIHNVLSFLRFPLYKGDRLNFF